VDRLENDLEGQAQVLRLNVWSSVGREIGWRYGVQGLPTFFLFDGAGQLLYKQAGRLDVDRVRAELNSGEMD
jgi:thioredoxin-related protein